VLFLHLFLVALLVLYATSVLEFVNIFVSILISSLKNVNFAHFLSSSYESFSLLLKTACVYISIYYVFVICFHINSHIACIIFCYCSYSVSLVSSSLVKGILYALSSVYLKATILWFIGWLGDADIILISVCRFSVYA
jgi:hypothetical protein